MNFTLAALQQLTAEAQVIRQRAALPATDGKQACKALGDILEKFRKQKSTVKLDVPKLEVKLVWAIFAAGRFELDGINELEFRTLCLSEETALRPEFIAALERSPERLKRSRCLYGLVHNYFLGWRVMQNPSAVEYLLCAVFKNYKGKNQVVQRWLDAKSLFSYQAATYLGSEICSESKGVDEVLASYYIGPLTNLARETRTAAADTARRIFRQSESSQSEGWSLEYLRWLIGKIFSDLISPEDLSATVSLLIMSESAKRSETFKRELRIYIQNHKKLGDPRLRESSPNWRAILPEAAQRYLSWLARDSIIFFFNTILPSTSENRRRKEFWLRYHDCIKDFQVAVSEEDLWKIKASHKASDLISYSQVGHPTTSAFLMQFEGYGARFLIVEFSETGNAAYIFKLADFEALRVTLRTPRFELKKHLKFDKKHRIIHNGHWEAAASYMLSTEFGIRP